MIITACSKVRAQASLCVRHLNSRRRRRYPSKEQSNKTN